ncbi:hypothetical protein CONLIGDRAFT_417979 [Coniochaeta ligniaria NRRL 30616]|uniref:Uncharacterized protein n=1 Tax=Coniochaeta ligniaria NRRL 30616 TaxID=1408157 RepID=A0A1J7JD89_9PEZI|nr:hypothetical protein CONLIGDRAFT_417979 [Coniochaeta ligniaria NRRL 30616]
MPSSQWRCTTSKRTSSASVRSQRLPFLSLIRTILAAISRPVFGRFGAHLPALVPIRQLVGAQSLSQHPLGSKLHPRSTQIVREDCQPMPAVANDACQQPKRLESVCSLTLPLGSVVGCEPCCRDVTFAACRGLPPAMGPGPFQGASNGRLCLFQGLCAKVAHR